MKTVNVSWDTKTRFWLCTIRDKKGRSESHAWKSTIEEAWEWIFNNLVRFEEFRKIARDKMTVTMLIKATHGEDIF
jgi:hypothetical protein